MTDAAENRDFAELTPEKIAELPFETALGHLETIIAELEKGHAALDRSLHLYEVGSRLRKHCENRLEAARLRVMRLNPDADIENPEAETIDPDSLG